MPYTYILCCCDQTLYTGWTVNLENRIKCHNQGKASKYTRARLPVKLVYKEWFDSKKQAMQREREIKKLTKKQKLALCFG